MTFYKFAMSYQMEFYKMEKNVVKQVMLVGILMAVLTITGCSNKKEASAAEQGSENTAVTETQVSSMVSTENDGKLKDEIKQRVEYIYSDVFKNDVNSNYESKYFTKDFYDTYAEAKSLSASTGDIIIDHDLWYQAQDWNKMSVEVTNVDVLDSSSSQDLAYVYLDLTDTYDNQVIRTPIVLLFENEDGEWKIDDIRRVSDGTSEKDLLKENIESAKLSTEGGYSLQQGTNESLSRWQGGYYQDEFGDSRMDQPLIATTISSVYGTPLGIQISKVKGIIFDCSSLDVLFVLGNGSSLSIKRSNGEVLRIPFDVEGDNIRVTSSSAIKNIISVFDEGYFKMAIVASEGEYISNTYNFEVTDETSGIRTALAWLDQQQPAR